MKYDRIQEMFRYITPGFFLLALVFVINFNEISDNEKLKDAIARFSAGGWTWCHFVWVAVVLIVLTFFWYHQTCVYMKYLFAEYGKTLQK